MVPLAAVVWTYRMSFPLVAIAMTALVLLAVAYYHRIAVPAFLAKHQRQLDEGGSPQAVVQPLRGRRPATSERGRLAA